MKFRRGWIAAVPVLLAGCASGGGSTGDAPLPALVSGGGTGPASGGGGTPPTYVSLIDPVASPAAQPALRATATESSVRSTAAPGGQLANFPLAVAFGLGAVASELRAVRVSAPSLGLDVDLADLELVDGGPVRPDLAYRWVDAPLEAGTTRSGLASVVLPDTDGLRYGTLGRWALGDSSTQEIWAGYTAFGSRTVASDVPRTGTASYSGFLDGVAFLSGAGYSIDAVASATVDFSLRLLHLSTTGSARTDGSGTRTSDASLDIAGTLAYAAGSITLAGPVSAGNGMTGSADATFFGPLGVEVAGTIRLAGNGGLDQWMAGFALRQGQPPGGLPAYVPRFGCSAGATCALTGDIVRTRDYRAGATAGFATQGTPSGTQTRIAIAVDATGTLTRVDVTLPADALATGTGAVTLPSLTESFSVAAAGDATARILRASGTLDSTLTGWVLDPSRANLSYASFGYWAEQATAGGGSVRGIWAGGSVSTSLTQVPATGSATYTGTAAGRFHPASGAATEFLADVTASADFTSRRIAFQTAQSRMGVNVLSSPGSGTAASHLDLSGTLSWSATSNSLSGSVATSTGMTGSASGAFYGAAAEEIAGTFGAAGANGDRLVGGFAARR